MNKDVKNAVLKYSVISAVSVLLVLTLTFLGLFLFAPKNLGNLVNSLGWKESALYLYEKHYHEKDNSNINDNYNILVLSSAIGKYDKVVRYYDRLVERDNYGEFIKFMDESVLNSDYSLPVKSVLLNTENYIEREYVNALLKTDYSNYSIFYAINSFRNYKNYTLTNPGVYVLDLFLNDENINKEFTINYLKQNYMATGKPIAENLKEYLNDISLIFDNLNSNTNSNEHVFYLYLQDRAGLVANNLVYYNGLNNNELPSSKITNTEINALLLNINNKVRNFILN